MSDVTDYAGSAIVDMGPCRRATVICQIRDPHSLISQNLIAIAATSKRKSDML